MAVDRREGEGPEISISGIGPMCAEARSAADLRAAPDRADGEADWFDPQEYLGKRGFKYFMPCTRYLLAAARVALDDARIPDGRYQPEDCGVAVGTNFGMISSHAEFDDVILAEGADSLSPMSAPNFSVNLAAGQVSIQHDYRAFNITLTSPVVAGLEALMIGASSIRQGRARMVVAAATEEAAPESTAPFLGLPATGSGACALVLERRSARDERAEAYSRLGDCACWFYPDSPDGADQLPGHLRRQLDAVIPPRSKHLSVCFVASDHPFGRRVTRHLSADLQARRIEVAAHRFPASDGRYVTVSPLLEVASLAMRQGQGLVVATSPFGHIAMLSLYKPDGAPRK